MSRITPFFHTHLASNKVPLIILTTTVDDKLMQLEKVIAEILSILHESPVERQLIEDKEAQQRSLIVGGLPADLERIKVIQNELGLICVECQMRNPGNVSFDATYDPMFMHVTRNNAITPRPGPHTHMFIVTKE